MPVLGQKNFNTDVFINIDMIITSVKIPYVTDILIVDNVIESRL
jgi:hypothetical protein